MLVSEFKNDYSLIHLLLQINRYLQLREIETERPNVHTHTDSRIYTSSLKMEKWSLLLGFWINSGKNWFLLLFRLIMRLRWRWQNFFLQKMVVLFITFEEPYDNDGFVLQGELCKKEISCLPRASCHAQILFD